MAPQGSQTIHMTIPKCLLFHSYSVCTRRSGISSYTYQTYVAYREYFLVRSRKVPIGEHSDVREVQSCSKLWWRNCPARHHWSLWAPRACAAFWRLEKRSGNSQATHTVRIVCSTLLEMFILSVTTVKLSFFYIYVKDLLKVINNSIGKLSWLSNILSMSKSRRLMIIQLSLSLTRRLLMDSCRHLLSSCQDLTGPHPRKKVPSPSGLDEWREPCLTFEFLEW